MTNNMTYFYGTLCLINFVLVMVNVIEKEPISQLAALNCIIFAVFHGVTYIDKRFDELQEKTTNAYLSVTMDLAEINQSLKDRKDK